MPDNEIDITEKDLEDAYGYELHDKFQGIFIDTDNEVDFNRKKQLILKWKEESQKLAEVDEHNKVLRMRITDRVIEIQNLSHTIESLAKYNLELESKVKSLNGDLRTNIFYKKELESQLQLYKDTIKEFYVCMSCRHLARLDEVGKNSELRMCPKCHVQLQSFDSILQKLRNEKK